MMQASTRISTGNRIQAGGSCGVRGRSDRVRAEEGAVDEAQRIGDAEGARHASRRTAARRRPAAAAPGADSASAKNISLDRKPFSSGTPAMAAAATMASRAVNGMERFRPERRRMSRVPVSWSMMPAAMNSDALKVAWFMMWKIAATRASSLLRPSSSVISPRWLMVE